MDERRKAQRLRALKAGSISFNRAAGIDCCVRNMSAAGACLEVASQAGIPGDFVLIVSYDKFSRPCHVIWRSDTRMGVKFCTAGPQGLPTALMISRNCPTHERTIEP